ncbi:MAG: Y-family DNA polymerase [Candidatus Dojkabacteria bacterium]
MLSNNDGCVVSRSNEAKKVGVPMGVAVYEIEKLIKQHKVIMLSSNFSLYADMSSRVMKTLDLFASELEVYSIDEAFISLDTLWSEHKPNLLKEIQQTVYKHTGIPISLGGASTKTMAKLANRISKKMVANNQPVDFKLVSQAQIDSWMKQIAVEDVWGVGFRTTPKLNRLGIQTAYDLKVADVKAMKKEFGVCLYRTIQELNEITCLPLGETSTSFGRSEGARQSIACTRTFGKRIYKLEHLEEALTQYISMACQKLRSQKSVARMMHMYIRSGKHTTGSAFYIKSAVIKLPEHTDDTRILVKEASKQLRQIYKHGVGYKKAGVTLFEILPKAGFASNMFWGAELSKSHVTDKTFSAVDCVNKKWGDSTVKLASQGTLNIWKSKRELVSNRFTTCWNELLKVS